jgi:hypothetical protein
MKTRIALLLSPAFLLIGFAAGRWTAPTKVEQRSATSLEFHETALTGEGNPGFKIEKVTFMDHRLKPLSGTAGGTYYVERESEVTYVNENSLTRAFHVRCPDGVTSNVHTVFLPPTGVSGAQTVRGRMSIAFSGVIPPAFMGSGSGYEAKFPTT